MVPVDAPDAVANDPALADLPTIAVLKPITRPGPAAGGGGRVGRAHRAARLTTLPSEPGPGAAG